MMIRVEDAKVLTTTRVVNTSYPLARVLTPKLMVCPYKSYTLPAPWKLPFRGVNKP
jgi:hypothetical protein